MKNAISRCVPVLPGGGAPSETVKTSQKPQFLASQEGRGLLRRGKMVRETKVSEVVLDI